MIFVYLLCDRCLLTLLLRLNIPELQIVHRLDGVTLPRQEGHHPPPEPGPAPAAVHHHPQLQEQVQDQESHCKPDNPLLHILGDAEIFKPLLTEELPNTIVEGNYHGLWLVVRCVIKMAMGLLWMRYLKAK